MPQSCAKALQMGASWDSGYVGCGANAGWGRRKACVSGVGVGGHVCVIIYSPDGNISPSMSRGVLECDTVMLQNDVLTILW